MQPQAPATDPDRRIQSAMVLYALERALGEYVNRRMATEPEHIASAAQSQKSRGAAKGKDAPGPTSAAEVIEASYLGELFDMALRVENGQSAHFHVTRLRQLADALELIQIRNAVCHPNRPFHDCYWYRMAALAADPTVAALGLSGVRAALDDAQAGRISRPPEQWLAAAARIIPNNLPAHFEHHITGLIGRKKDAADLRKLLAGRRFPLIAVLGPGGTGKTALVLDVLHECSLNPATAEWARHIVFVTAKHERLEVGGVVSIEGAAKTMADLEHAIIDALAEMLDLEGDYDLETISKHLGGAPLLLCIDNLETVLRDAQHAFDEFFQRLPAEWRVVVTSRMAVNAAMTLPLPGLTQGYAEQLVRQYLHHRGGQALSPETVSQIATACNDNPLAIRLTVDAYVAGRPINQALSAAKANVLEFSLANLIAALPADALEVLECLFANSEPLSRQQLVSILSSSHDRVGEAMNALLRTSVLSRQIKGINEVYALTQSIRDLFVIHPPNPKLRAEITEKVLRYRQWINRAQAARRQSNPLQVDFIPELPPQEVALAVKAFEASRSSDVGQLGPMLDEVNRATLGAAICPTLQRAIAELRWRLGDRVGATRALDEVFRAVGVEGDPAGALRLAQLYAETQRLQESLAVGQALMEDGWDDPKRSSVQSAARVIDIYWTVRIALGESAAAAESLEGWSQSGELRMAHGALYATALRREIESAAKIKGERKNQVIGELLKLHHELLQADGAYEPMIAESLNFIASFPHYCQMLALPEGLALEMATFMEAHLGRLCRGRAGWSLGSKPIRAAIQAVGALRTGRGPNPMAAKDWQYVPAIVSNVPNERDFVFATGVDDGNSYFVHFSKCSMSPEERARLRRGDTLLVRPGPRPSAPGKAAEVLDARLGDQPPAVRPVEDRVIGPPADEPTLRPAPGAEPDALAPEGGTTVEAIECPSCAARVEVRLGVRRGDTATTTCRGCATLFNVHRGGARLLVRIAPSLQTPPQPVTEASRCEAWLKRFDFRGLRDGWWRAGIRQLHTLFGPDGTAEFPTWEELKDTWKARLTEAGHGELGERVNQFRQLAFRARLFQFGEGGKGVGLVRVSDPDQLIEQVERHTARVFYSTGEHGLPSRALIDFLTESNSARLERTRAIVEEEERLAKEGTSDDRAPPSVQPG